MKDVDPRLLDVFAPIARDLVSAGFRTKLRMESRLRTEWLWAAVLYVDGERLGIVEVDPDASKEGQVERLAEQVQDYILEFVRHGPEAVVWPRCRSGHNHPMVIENSPDSPARWPYWICPLDRDYRLPIGGLPADK